jgi:hypothetical protein
MLTVAWRDDAPDRPHNAARALSPLLGKPAEVLLAKLNDTGEGPVGLIADGVDFEIGRQIQALALPGISARHQALLP